MTLIRSVRVFWMTLSVCWILSAAPAFAEVATDGSLGPAVSLDGPAYIITADLGTQAGANLFHSFDAFNIDTGESALFTGPDSIENIISRVTGGSASWIDGCLGSDISGVNLFLINPAGVMFGPNASLDIGGSFHVSTADYLVLGEDARFEADLGRESVLSAAAPSAFGFLGDNISAIDIQGQLWVEEGQSLSVIGGDIDIQGGVLAAPGGCINLASAASAGQLSLEDMDASSFEVMGDIRLADGAFIYTSAAGAGDIYIRGGRFEMTDSYIIANSADQNGGVIDVRLSDDLIVSNSGIEAAAFGDGKGADVVLDVNRLDLIQGGYILMSVLGAGQGGDLDISAGQSVLISGYSSISALNFGSGDAGDISISTPLLNLEDYATIAGSAIGSGDGADIRIFSSLVDLTQGSIISSDAFSDGNAGDILIETDRLSVTEGASISSKVVQSDALAEDLLAIGIVPLSDHVGEGVGDGGNISIVASQSVLISGEGPTGIPSFLDVGASGSGQGGSLFITTPELIVDDSGLVFASTTGDGDAGNITVNVERLTLSGGGQINATSVGVGDGGDIIVNASESVEIFGENQDGVLSGIQSRAKDDGDAGSIYLSAGSLEIFDGGQIIASTLSSGQGGNISIDADHIALFDNGLISAQSQGVGDAGDIVIHAVQSICLTDSRITTEALLADGGNISIDAGHMLYLVDSAITATVAGGAGDGGNIFIDPDFVILNNSSIIANAYAGDGGNIFVSAGQFIASAESRVQASSELGIDGTVEINSPDVDLSAGLSALGASYLDVSGFLSDRCSLRSSENASSLVLIGRGGMPMQPDDLVPEILSDDAADDRKKPDDEDAAGQ